MLLKDILRVPGDRAPLRTRLRLPCADMPGFSGLRTGQGERATTGGLSAKDLVGIDDEMLPDRAALRTHLRLPCADMPGEVFR